MKTLEYLLKNVLENIVESIMNKDKEFSKAEILILIEKVEKYLLVNSNTPEAITENNKKIVEIFKNGASEYFNVEKMQSKLNKMGVFEIIKKMVYADDFIYNYQDRNKKEIEFAHLKRKFEDNTSYGFDFICRDYSLSFMIISILDEYFNNYCIDYLMINKQLSTYDIRLFKRITIRENNM